MSTGVDGLRRLARPGVGTISTATTGLLGSTLARVVGPRPGAGRVTFQVEPGPPERWIRRFGRRCRTSCVQLDDRGDLIERVGPLMLRFSVAAVGSAAVAELRRISIGPMSLPSARVVAIRCLTTPDPELPDRWSTAVSASVCGRRRPLAGVTYIAELEAAG